MLDTRVLVHDPDNYLYSPLVVLIDSVGEIERKGNTIMADFLVSQSPRVHENVRGVT